MWTGSSTPTRRDLLAAAATGATSSFPDAARAASETSKADAIRPFRIDVPEDALVDRERVDDESQGVQLAAMQEIARYWGTDYDWRKCETKLNTLPQFITEIDGLEINFIHVRSKHENAFPLIVTHGWPGSVIAQLKIIPYQSHSPWRERIGRFPPRDSLHSGLRIFGQAGRTARAWVALMKRLGYTRFVAQGGDLGAGISEVMALQAPPELLAKLSA
jgi:pimeloyl-ACP methyl ester carboxylesterase